MKKFLLLLSLVSVALAVWAQTNVAALKPVAKKPADQNVDVTSGHFVYDGGKHQMIYYDKVMVTNAQGLLTCERLTIDVPPEGSTNSQPTNAVAETNVIIDIVKNGDTNHVTCDKAVYTYTVVNAVTNDTITFTGSPDKPAKVTNSKGWMTGEPLVWDKLDGSFSGVNTETHFKAPEETGKGTNAPADASPLNFFNPK
jgi:lipopolysaccharide export system protein LptA